MHIQLIKLATFFTYGDDDEETQPEDHGDVTVWTDQQRKIFACQWWSPDPSGGHRREFGYHDTYADCINAALSRTGWGRFNSEVMQGTDR